MLDCRRQLFGTSIGHNRQVHCIFAIEEIHRPGLGFATEQEHGHVSAKALQKQLGVNACCN